MPKDFRGFYLKTGGVAGALDNIAVATFEDLDGSFVMEDGAAYLYSFDSASTEAESDPMYIRPDDNAAPTAGVHVLQSLGVNNLTLEGTIELEDTTSSTTGVIYKGADRFIHNYHDATVLGGALQELNVCIGIKAGNFSMGSGATEVYHSSRNTFVGSYSGSLNEKGYYNNFVGYGSGYNNIDGFQNNFMGNSAGFKNIDGYYNNFEGYLSGYSNIGGNRNNFMGWASGYYNTEGIQNCYVGAGAGRFYNGVTGANTISDYCTVIGNDASVSADGVEREIVLGYSTIGKGTDTAIIGAEGTNERVYLTGGATVNDEGADYDTQIKGSTDDNLFYVDAGNDRVGIRTNTPNETLSVDGIINIPKGSGNGIQIDTTSGNNDWGWHDIIGNVVAPNSGATKPTLAAFRNGIYAQQFGINDEEHYTWHIPHDWAPGTDIYLHIHWSHDSGAVTGGTATFTGEVIMAKRGAAFPASVTGTVTANASTTQYYHHVDEIQLSAASPSGTQIDTDDIEVDALILCTVKHTANGMTGATPDPFIFEIDLHYQSTGVPTKAKASDFYT